MFNKENILKITRFLFLFVLIFAIPMVTRNFNTSDSMNWYHNLNLSPINPPDWIFAPVWTILYAMMVVSAYLMWNKASPRFFVLQLACNGFWSFAFFYLKMPGLALGTLITLLVFLALTIKIFYAVSKTAGWLLVPVFVWCLFAFYLNAYIVCFN